jgi:TPR repeat protein
VEKDVSKGLSLWKKAADAGDSGAMLFFGDSYYTGDSGTPKDLTLGARYILKAAESGNELARRVADKYGIKK